MCLYVKSKQAAKVAKDIIKCYKSVDMVSNKVPLGTAYELRSTNKVHFGWVSGKIHTSILCKSGTSIYEGLHTYKEMSGALSDSGQVILICEIPKGAKYYEGSHNGTYSGYASDKLVVVEIRYKANVRLDAVIKQKSVANQVVVNKAFKEIQKQHKILKSLLY